MTAPSASKAQGGKQAQHGVECQTLYLGGRHRETQSTLECHSRRACWHLCSVPTSELRKEAERRTQPVQGQSHACTLLKPEGFMRALAITTTICCAGRDRSCFSLFQALKPEKPISAQEATQ